MKRSTKIAIVLALLAGDSLAWADKKHPAPTAYEGKGADYWASVISDSPTDQGSQWHAKEALVKLGENALPVMCPLIKNEDYRVNRIAWDVLREIQQKNGAASVRSVLPCAIEALNTGDGIDVVVAFGKDAEAAIPAILETRNLPHHTLPAAALVQIGTPAAAAALVPFLADADADYRIAAADALGKFGAKAKEHVPKLLALLSSQDFRDCEAAAKALKDVGLKKELVPQLLERLERPDQADGFRHDNDYNICRSAILADVGALGPDAKDAVPLLIKLLDDELIGNVAASTLADLGPVALPAMPRVVELMWTPTSTSRQFLSVVLQNIGQPAVPDLEKMARDPSEDLSRYAKQALSAIKQKPKTAHARH